MCTHRTCNFFLWAPLTLASSKSKLCSSSMSHSPPSKSVTSMSFFPRTSSQALFSFKISSSWSLVSLRLSGLFLASPVSPFSSISSSSSSSLSLVSLLLLSCSHGLEIWRRLRQDLPSLSGLLWSLRECSHFDVLLALVREDSLLWNQKRRRVANLTALVQRSQGTREASSLWELGVLQNKRITHSLGVEARLQKETESSCSQRIVGSGDSRTLAKPRTRETERRVDKNGERSGRTTERNSDQHSRQRGRAADDSVASACGTEVWKNNPQESRSRRLQLHAQCLQHLHWKYWGRCGSSDLRGTMK